MNWKRNRLKKANLYVLVDTTVCKNPVVTAKKAVISGADIIQLRSYGLKDNLLLDIAKKIKKICQNDNCIFIVNNRIDIAYLSGADGIHLGQNDINLKDARSILKGDKVFGNSCHNKNELKNAIKEKFDYVSSGPVFKTQTKPEYRKIGIDNALKIFNNNKIPAFAIGGINLSNINTLIENSINKIAVCSCVCRSKNIRKTVQSLKSRLD